MKTAIYPGSFDPVTLGHLDIIKRAAGLFDKLIIGVLVNKNKVPFFTLEERVEMLKEITKEIGNVEIISFEGLLADFCRENKINGIIRGIRCGNDVEYEMPMAQINHNLCPETETVFLTTSPSYSYISSSAVKELALFGGDYHFMLPEQIISRVDEKVNKQKRK